MHILAKFYLDQLQFILSQSGGRKPQILPSFGLQRFVESQFGGIWKKLNTVAELQTFPCVKIVSVGLLQRLSVADRQTNKKSRNRNVPSPSCSKTSSIIPIFTLVDHDHKG